MRPACFKKPIAAMVFIGLIMAISGCGRKSALPEIPNTTQIQGKNRIQKLIHNVNHQYPDRFKAMHHVALTLLGKTYVLNGYLTVNRPDRQIHLIAQNDMGGTLFEVHIQGEDTHIQSNTNLLKPSWLKLSVLKDLENLYLNSPLPSPILSLRHDNALVLSGHWQNISREYTFKPIVLQPNSHQLTGYRHLKNSRQIYAIDYIYDKKNNGNYPSFVSIDDRELHYQLKINIAYFFTPTSAEGKQKK